MYKKILVPIDGSKQSETAENTAIELAKLMGGEVTLIHVLMPPTQYMAISGEGPITISQDMMNLWEENGQKLVDSRIAKYENCGVKVNTLLFMGHPADTICQKAKDGKFDLIVIGSRGLGAIKGYLLGSVSDRVSHHANCSVLIVH